MDLSMDADSWWVMGPGFLNQVSTLGLGSSKPSLTAPQAPSPQLSLPKSEIPFTAQRMHVAKTDQVKPQRWVSMEALEFQFRL